MGSTLTHAEQSQPAPIGRDVGSGVVAADAIVLDDDIEDARMVSQRDATSAGMCVARDVRQGFLNDSVSRHLYVGLKPRGHVLLRKLTTDAAAFRKVT